MKKKNVLEKKRHSASKNKPERTLEKRERKKKLTAIHESWQGKEQVNNKMRIMERNALRQRYLGRGENKKKNACGGRRRRARGKFFTRTEKTNPAAQGKKMMR